MNSYFKLFLLFAFIFSFIEANEENDYNNLLKWGLKNSLIISDKIKIEIDTKNKTMKYVAKNLIPEDELIMDIPPEIMIGCNSSLKLLNTTRFPEIFEKFMNINKASGETFNLEQSFMSYILYITKKKQKTYKKTNFIKYYKPLLKNLKDKNIESTPFYFSNEQIRLFLNTSFGSIFEIINRFILDEINSYENIFFNKSINYDEYLPMRLLSIIHGLNISNHHFIVPFFHLFENSYSKYNCNFTIENNHVKIFSKKNIFPGESVVVKPDYTTNINGLIFMGITNEEMINVFPSFDIPAVVPFFIESEGGKLNDVDFSSRVDLAEPKFYERVLSLYKDICRKLKKDDSDINAYKLFLKNLKSIRENYDYVTESDIHRVFFKQQDIINARRIFRGEKNFIDTKIKELNDFISTFDTKGKNKSKNKKNTDL